MVKVGDAAPDFTAAADTGEEFTLGSLRGSRVVLYFYPKDNTPGCTQEACDFRDLSPALSEKNAVVVGVSIDSVKSHRNFKNRYSLPFTLVADPDKAIVNRYGVWVEKKNYGRSYMGVARTTLVIDENGVIEHVFDNVKVKGHAGAVLGSL
ncbi:MAG: thioredoxin-dependent thiol peroxidase [Chloroflexota bacterium]|nr:thioredoxin-dependent thiol peroxidase [Chloroflexota bacterium]MDE2884418.1 thioredoxin-dependent thiol peroxidase [Chloroflexota bacterium]